MLQAKLCMPHIGEHIIRRKRVEENLRQLPNYQFAFLSAPAGYGKTTAVADYLTREKLKYAWFSIDRADNDPVQFWKYLMEAVSSCVSESGTAEIALSAELIAAHIPVDYLIGIIEQSREKFVLVLDDYHLVEDDTVLHSVEHFVKYLPQNVNLIILSRKEPERVFSVLRARGMAVSLGARDIAFDSQETSEFFAQKGFRLTEQEIAAVNTRTEGWAAGLVAAAFSFEISGSVIESISAFSGEDQNIESFLGNEVFKRWPGEVRAFLVSTAFLDKLSGPLCDAVTGNHNSEALLKTLSKSNSFVIPLDSVGKWYRYHPLFQEFLLVRLNEENEKTRRRLFSLAGEWYLSNGSVIDAINCLLDAGEYERAYPYIFGYRQEEMVADYSMWKKWIDRIPETLYENDPTVYTSYSWISSMENKTDEAELWTRKTRACFERIKWSLIPEQRNYVEAHVLFAEVNTAIWKMDVDRALERMYRLSQIKLTAPVILGEMNWDKPNLLKTAYGFWGRLNLIEKGLSAMSGLDSLIGDYAAYFAVTIAEYFYERNCLREMDAILTDHMGWILGVKFPGVIVPCFLLLAKRNMAKGNVKLALKSVAEARKLLSGEKKSLWNYFLDGFEAKLHLSVGDGEEARELIDIAKLGLYDPLTAVRETEYTVWARCLMSENRLEDALTLLNRLTDFARKENQLSSEVELLCLTAICRAQSGDTIKALQALEQALAIGEREGYARSFIDEGEPMAELLSQYLTVSRSEATLKHMSYAKKLFRLTNEYTALIKSASREDGTGNPANVFPSNLLSKRELEILELLSQRRSNAEIAAALYVSLSTVKQHNNNIFDKLGVKNRIGAVARAKELGLIKK